MVTRRDFLSTTLGGSSLLAVGSVVPEFLAASARAAGKTSQNKETILVVIEMTGGNDGLNMVAPVGDDLYYKARPTIALARKDTHRLDDYHGLNPRMNRLKQLYDKSQLAVVQGVGYPNPDRSHFESMDIWQLADPRRSEKSGWLARATPTLGGNGIPGLYVGADRLPVALQGADGSAISLTDRESFRLQLNGNAPARKKLITDLNAVDPASAELASFVRKCQLQTYSSLQRIEEALKETTGTSAPSQPQTFRPGNRNTEDGNLRSLGGKLGLVSRLIQKDLGTRIYYAPIAGFDTHTRQLESQGELLGELSEAIGTFFDSLGDELSNRVVVMTYSEFGRRVQENGSRGTDHGAASCLFVAGPKVKGGLVGAHPKLDDLTSGDLKHHTDFRRVYATLLDQWLGVPSVGVLGGKFEPLPLIESEKRGA